MMPEIGLFIKNLLEPIVSDYYFKIFPDLARGCLQSIKIIVPSALLGLLIGTFVGAIRGTGYPNKLLWLCNAYVSLFRGTALIVQLFLFYYGLPNVGRWLNVLCQSRGWPLVGDYLSISPYAASIIIFSLCSGAYHSEYIRGAILSIKKGQFMAAKALGFTSGQTFFSLVIPQAIRRAWAGCGNEIIYLIKYSSLAFLVTFKELTGTAKSLAGSSFRVTETFILAALFYLVMITVATLVLRRLEKAMAIPGFGNHQ